MKKNWVSCISLILVVGAAAIAQEGDPAKKSESKPGDDETAVRAVVDQYFRGVVNADRELLEKAWDVDSAHMKHIKSLTGSQRVDVVPIPLAIDWWTRVKAKTSAGEVLYLDIVDGQMAFVKYKFDYNNLHYIDYLTLYKIGDSWKLVNKTFVRHAEPKKAAATDEAEEKEKDKTD